MTSEGLGEMFEGDSADMCARKFPLMLMGGPGSEDPHRRERKFYYLLIFKGQLSDMTSEWLGEMFEGDSADTCARKFPLMLMGGRANGPACADGERGPPSA